MFEYRGYVVEKIEWKGQWRLTHAGDPAQTVAYYDGDMTIDEIKADIDFHIGKSTEEIIKDHMARLDKEIAEAVKRQKESSETKQFWSGMEMAKIMVWTELKNILKEAKEVS